MSHAKNTVLAGTSFPKVIFAAIAPLAIPDLGRARVARFENDDGGDQGAEDNAVGCKLRS